MKTTFFLVLAIITLQASALPFKHQVALLNSLESGREEDPMVWECHGCDQATKPLASHVIKEDAKQIRAILSVYQDYTVLAFRYTINLKNIEQDLLWPIQVQDQNAPAGCKVQKEYDSMWNSIKNQTIKDLIARSHTKHLIITGISLGGALAMISYVDINHLKIFDKIQIIVYGTPRVGNKNWAEWIKTQVQTPPVHICLKDDPICIFPKCFTPICNYRHAGIGYRCNKKTQTCSPIGNVNELNEIQLSALMADVMEVLTEENDDHEVGGMISGIIDHIQNYKTLKEFTWVQN